MAKKLSMLQSAHARAMRLLKPLLSVYRVEIRELGNTAEEPVPGAEIRVATEQEIRKAQEDMPDQLSQTGISEALARGDVCVGGFVSEQMVSFVWRSYATTQHTDQVWVDFDPPYRYGYKSYTKPEFRGRRLLSLAASDPICIARGYTYGMSFIETHNYPSIRVNHRYGNKLVGFAGYMNLFGRIYCFRTPGARRHTFRFYVRKSEA